MMRGPRQQEFTTTLQSNYIIPNFQMKEAMIEAFQEEAELGFQRYFATPQQYDRFSFNLSSELWSSTVLGPWNKKMNETWCLLPKTSQPKMEKW